MNNFNKNDGQETVRQTLERVMRAKEKEQNNLNNINYQKLAQEYVTAIPYDRAYGQRPKSNYAWANASQNTSNNTTPQKYSVIGGALGGFAEGIMGGAERLANGLTGGVYGQLIDRGFSDTYTNRQNFYSNEPKKKEVDD
ncbi:MAG: hypothetical protein IJ677_05470 [Alphaproteobacteria bacterium]|nr:hypothetical protein [Alphaproteobacteria bacterium]